MTDNKIEITFPENIPVCNVELLNPYANNPRTHSDEQIEQLMASMREFGFTNPILADRDTKEVIAGHGRLLAARKLGLRQVPVIFLAHLNETKRRKLIIADNQLALNAGWDMELLATELSALNELGESLDVLGFEDEFLDEVLNTQIEENESPEERIEKLIERYGVPPFSILDVRQGYWQKRKKEWKDLIQEKGESREHTLFKTDSYMNKIGTVSILDPVLCETLINWFALPKKTKCIDPFAGDTSFGFVSSLKECEFIGIELRPEQVELNRARSKKFNLNAQYICDDGQNILKHVAPDSQDFLFSCPPYYDLEVYSDLEKDASNQETYEDFLKIITNAFSGAIKTLKNNRFAAIVVSNIRNNKTGLYRNFVNDIIKLFQNNGMLFYNDIILVDVAGSAAMRANHNMQNRKVVKTHQNVLIFYKGDPKKIPEIYNNSVFVDNYTNTEQQNAKINVNTDIIGKLDPVLYETLINWFSLGKGSKCIDLYANDTCPAFVSAIKECKYTGFTNNSKAIQKNKTETHKERNIKYICSSNILEYVEEKTQDFLFSVLPEITNEKEYKKLLTKFEVDFSQAIKSLNENRFAAIVLSNYRNHEIGCCFPLTDDIVKIFTDNGMAFYNDIVFLENIIEAQNEKNNEMLERKVVPVHKNVLIFYKGRPSQIKSTFTNIIEEESNESSSKT